MTANVTTTEVQRLIAAAESAERDAAAEWPGSYYRKAHKARARRLRRKATALQHSAEQEASR
jgi:hypothetical protein